MVIWQRTIKTKIKYLGDYEYNLMIHMLNIRE